MREKKDAVETALRQFTAGNLADNAKNLLKALGYESQRTMDLEPNTADEFRASFDYGGEVNPERARLDEWESIDLLFQLTTIKLVPTGKSTLTSTAAASTRNVINPTSSSRSGFAETDTPELSSLRSRAKLTSRSECRPWFSFNTGRRSPLP